MAYSYNAGTTTPTYAGLVEFNGIRINDGTFKSDHLAGLIDTPPVRSSLRDLSQDHGALDANPLYGVREIAISGWAYTGQAVDDVFSAVDQLRAAFALGDGSLKTLVFQQRGWATRRQVSARINGPLTIDEPDLVQKKKGSRSFTIPMIAPDPLAYDADNLKSVTISAGGSATLTNNGSVATPFIAQFNGAFTGPVTLTNNTASESIEYDGNALAGAYIQVQTNPAAPGGRTVTNNTGDVGYYQYMGAWSAFTIPPGTSTWSASGCSVTVIWRDAWV